MRRPTATTVSAASTKQSVSVTVCAFSAASRCATARGVSSRCGVSSMSGLVTRSGVMPICARSASRLGLAEARTSGAFAI
jgi:hypothetical protein